MSVCVRASGRACGDNHLEFRNFTYLLNLTNRNFTYLLTYSTLIKNSNVVKIARKQSSDVYFSRYCMKELVLNLCKSNCSILHTSALIRRKPKNRSLYHASYKVPMFWLEKNSTLKAPNLPISHHA